MCVVVKGLGVRRCLRSFVRAMQADCFVCVSMVRVCRIEMFLECVFINEAN